MYEFDIVSILILGGMIILIWLLIGIPIWEIGYQDGLCHGKYGTGSTYTNGECFISIK